MKKTNPLDQFYTNPKISDQLVKIVIKKYSKSKFFLEPSAGSGNFIDSLLKQGVNKDNISAYDIEPKNNEKIIKQDYLLLAKKFNKNRIIIGNPPFGKRSNLAIKFINHAAKQGGIVAMILPRQFNRYLTQKQIDENLKLVYSVNLEDDSFLVNDRKYDVKCVFQIYEKIGISKKKDLRLRRAESKTHEDFETRIHNNTKNTLKYFSKDEFRWDFAFHRQGFYDYNEIITDPQKLFKNRQYFFVRIKNPKAIKIIKSMNIQKLSLSNTQTPGYSTTDFIKEYNNIKGSYGK